MRVLVFLLILLALFVMVVAVNEYLARRKIRRDIEKRRKQIKYAMDPDVQAIEAAIKDAKLSDDNVTAYFLEEDLRAAKRRVDKRG